MESYFTNLDIIEIEDFPYNHHQLGANYSSRVRLRWLIWRDLFLLSNGIESDSDSIWVFPKIRNTPKWMVYNGKPF